MTKAEDELRQSLQVKPPSEVVEWLNLLVYGDPGAGKTFLAGTASLDKRTGPVLYLDVEGGVTTIRDRPVEVKSIRSIKEVEEIHNTLYKSIEGGKLLYYKTVVIDSLTELADLDMRTIMKEAYNANPDRVDIDVPSPREWGKTRSHIRTIVRAYRDLPCHVIFTASAGREQDEGQPAKFFPGFSGKLRTEVPGFCDIVGYLNVDTSSGSIERKLQVQGTRRVVAKDRTSVIGGTQGWMDNPSIPAMWDLIEGKSIIQEAA